VHGTADDSIPYGGGPFNGVGGGTTVLSAPAATARWASLNGCDATPTTTTDAGVRQTSYAGCRDGATVALRAIVGGGHEWPSDIGRLVADALTK
jgi:polyhydroxybutyrate depolymerase